MTIKFIHNPPLYPKVGDIVKIKSSLNEHTDYGSARYVQPMGKYSGKTTKITEISKFGENIFLHLEIDNHCWAWTQAMLELVESK